MDPLKKPRSVSMTVDPKATTKIKKHQRSSLELLAEHTAALKLNNELTAKMLTVMQEAQTSTPATTKKLQRQLSADAVAVAHSAMAPTEQNIPPMPVPGPLPVNLEKNILDFLKTQKSPVRAIQITRAIQGAQRTDVNRILYRLLEGNVIIKDEKLPLWSIRK
ncbi:protein ORF112 [Cyprinid herpesvirus 2]|uniref:Protein ORF112 n=1 Tax=Cyprinid herpesvirus 2 TaxID=317878 RepID=K7PC11_CYHV2|nr:protein ORF112 [Cyprinid herpesvirus 2]AFJ20538.1 protein ORF112 [Cyprinid herpesvirus 2]